MTPEETAPSPTRMGPGETTTRREAPPLPREPESRSGVLGLLLDDWPLKALALILAVMMWRLTRDRLTTQEEFNDVVVAVEGLPKGFVVSQIAPDRVKVTVIVQKSRERIAVSAERHCSKPDS